MELLLLVSPPAVLLCIWLLRGATEGLPPPLPTAAVAGPVCRGGHCGDRALLLFAAAEAAAAANEGEDEDDVEDPPALALPLVCRIKRARAARWLCHSESPIRELGKYGRDVEDEAEAAAEAVAAEGPPNCRLWSPKAPPNARGRSSSSLLLLHRDWADDSPRKSP